MTDFEILQILKQNFILGKADEQLLLNMITDGAVRIDSFGIGDEICSPRTKINAVGIMLSGTATVLPLSEGGNTLLKTLCPNEMFGISNLFSDTLPFPTIITSKAESSVLFIDKNSFKYLIDTDKNALEAYICVLNNKIAYLNQKISTLTAGSAEKRLALYLAENECNGLFSSDLSMSSLSDMLNIGRASLYRALDTLIQNGLISKQGKKIFIHDKNALLKY